MARKSRMKFTDTASQNRLKSSRKMKERRKKRRTAKPLRDPRDPPTAAERATREATHLSFRSWCAECVAGRRDKPPLFRVRPDENAVPDVPMDCCFALRDDETETVTILLMKDWYSRATEAWVVERKRP